MKITKAEADPQRLYLHIEFHMQNPPPHQIKRLFSELVLRCPGRTLLKEIDNGSRNFTIPNNAMIIANHRAPNLGYMFSYQDISKKSRPPVSSYL